MSCPIVSVPNGCCSDDLRVAVRPEQRHDRGHQQQEYEDAQAHQGHPVVEEAVRRHPELAAALNGKPLPGRFERLGARPGR
jgi:hypothetical protein